MATGTGALPCPNEHCTQFGLKGQSNIGTHGWYQTKRGRRRRYKCRTCGATFASTRGSTYHRLRGSRKKVEQAAHMSAKGIGISTIARRLGRTWNTIHRWLECARAACTKFLAKHLRNYKVQEPQADEIKVFVGPRRSKIWGMALIEASTRLWPVTQVGKRSYKNIRILFGEALHRESSDGRVRITSDGFQPYAWVLKLLFGPACYYGQVVKKWKKNRVTKVDREIVIGEPWQIKHALECSENSEQLNTSFIEHLNLTMRRNTAYLHRQTPCHARCPEALLAQLDLQRCYDNFMREHVALKSGSETWTPAMMAGIATRKLTWRDIFEGRTSGLFYLFLFLRPDRSIRLRQAA